MSTAATTSGSAGSVVDQARCLVEQTRLLPADEAAVVLEQVVGIAQAAQLDRLIAAERSGDLTDSGCRTVRSFAATILRRGVHDAEACAVTARHLVDFPRLAAAYRAGQVHTGNLRTVLKHRKACGLEALQAHEEQLVLLATRTGPREIGEFCQQLADLNRPDRDEARARALGLRSVRIVRVGDLARLDAMLDPVVAAQLKATLAAMTTSSRAAERAAQRDAAKATKAATAAAGDGNARDGEGDGDDGWGVPDPGRDPRTHGERSADALEHLLRRAMDGIATTAGTAGTGGTGGTGGAGGSATSGSAGGAGSPAGFSTGRARPRATVSVQLETLLGLSGHGQALLHRFGVIGSRTAERLCCDALVRLIVKQGERVLNVGHRKRVVTARQHTALAEQHATCVVPGCQIPFADCDIHHLWWWSLGGPTDLDLLLPVCGSHHRWLHEGGYTITRHDGVLVFRDPRGRTITNLQHTLQTQLDLLHDRHRPPPDDEHHSSTDQIATQGGGWPDSPYRHGSWGWTGHNPGPPPGHAPPQTRSR